MVLESPACHGGTLEGKKEFFNSRHLRVVTKHNFAVNYRFIDANHLSSFSGVYQALLLDSVNALNSASYAVTLKFSKFFPEQSLTKRKASEGW